eukprot:TRINITY_DN19224_c0_g2_i1.p1 TRINITY_DN19224_c0_g2~~TRINITY_DN19224_c0_g2_i1.p1  ORF type:complete len:389 (-),score=51.58 TRINITY_DN19224_c0_g2_i1:151-1317(-)
MLLFSFCFLVFTVHAEKEGKGATGACAFYFGKGDCWVDPEGKSAWVTCKAEDEDACKLFCDDPTKVASQCQSKEEGTKENDPAKDALSFSHTWKGTQHMRTYKLASPSEGQSPSGLVIVLTPSGGSCGALETLSQRMHVLVACPFAKNGGWKNFKSAGDSEDVDFMASLIQHLTSTHNILAANVLVTGFSAGGSMAYRLSCESSASIGGIVLMGQAFLEPAAGHIAKGDEKAGVTATEQVLESMRVARNSTDKCDPQVNRPHYALVGVQDSYYGETSGAYKGKALWEFYSKEFLGCSGTAQESTDIEATRVSGRSKTTCYFYAECSGIKGHLNKYCTADNMGHVMDGWDDFVAGAFADFTNSNPASSSQRTQRGSVLMLACVILFALF